MKTTLQRSLSLLLALVLSLSLVLPAAAAPAEAMALDRDSAVLTPGERLLLTAALVPETEEEQTILWQSDAPAVAEVSDSGRVTALAEGTATVTARLEGTTLTAACRITVVKSYVSAVTIGTEAPSTLAAGSTSQFTARVSYAGTAEAPRWVDWSSSDPRVADVSVTGLVTGLSQGTATISARSRDAGPDGQPVTAQWTLTVTPASDRNQDGLFLASRTVSAQAALYRDARLEAPDAAVRRGETDVTSNYTFSYRWTDGENRVLSETRTLTLLPTERRDMEVYCTVTATHKTSPSRTLLQAAVYQVTVYPGTVLGATLDVESGPVALKDLLDADGTQSVVSQLIQGGQDPNLTPAVPGLTQVTFDLTSVTGPRVGSLNAEANALYAVSGSGKQLGDLTFTPTSAGTYTISFMAFGRETYYGLLEIVVTGKMTPGEGILYCDSSGFTFTGSDFFHEDDNDPIASAVFGTPTAGKLLRDFFKGSGIPDLGDAYYTDSASKGDYHISTLSYLPSAGYSGLAEIPVTLTTLSGQVIRKTVQIDVRSKNASDVFSDVIPSTVGNWAANSVDFAYDYNLVQGIGGDLFGPYLPMNRAMLVTVLYRAAGEPAMTITTNFTDLDVGSYYYNAVVWASYHGIVNGISDGIFGPNLPVTRQQIAAILHRYANTMGPGAVIDNPDSLKGYTDKGLVEAYAVEPMTWAVSRGIISGMTSSTLDPRGNATRAQVAVILHRYLIGQ